MPKDARLAPASPASETFSDSSSRSRRKHGTPADVPADSAGPSGQDVLLFLIGSRLLNALIIQTFFQPDEYFQALEPAWALAFGSEAGAWITWEWKKHLRSAIHPAIFATCYKAAEYLANALALQAPFRAQLLLATPKVAQAVIAALGDYYTWRLSEAIYGVRSLAPAAALVLTVASPWQWFCSTRTFSNSLETTLTIIALYNWPWHWSSDGSTKDTGEADAQGLRKRTAVTLSHGDVDETTRLRRALLFAALATILRPTNILIWFAMTILTCLRGVRSHKLVNVPGTEHTALIEIAGYTLLPTKTECKTFLREAVLCGGVVLAISAVVDRLFYLSWTFPPWNFLYFNVAQSIAIFYGNNDWHYYLSQGYPLLLTTALPFALIGMYRSVLDTSAYRNLSQSSRNALSNLTIASLFVPAMLSIISHKEVRFIYPLLPGLHILAAHPLSTHFASAFDSLRPYSQTSQLLRRALLAILLAINLLISLYTATLHNVGLVTITEHLRTTFETHYLPLPGPIAQNMTVGFLMPCHSTPWRSHLQYPPTSSSPGIDAWALTCEPPLDLNATAKATYLDEADQFYVDPTGWLKRHMSRNPPVAKLSTGGVANHEAGLFAGHTAKPRRVFEIETKDEEELWRERRGRRPWPEYLVFFQQLEPQMKTVVGRRSGYRECERVWNSHWHDDWRRTGDVVVWCLYPERRTDVANVAGKEQVQMAEARRKAAIGGQRESTVEKPFWKQRPLLGRSEPAGWWDWVKWKTGLEVRKKGWLEGLMGRGGGDWN
ncbi:uncharacterized protein HMPREF1541_06743 [Cyphellophora europaea CBS 101466]|uniref:Mannosyltransferase n=1 Tax=Cyphellophora europaea (strain CBS 101466) TaxID=1220924 RepID=W2RQ94_CYPE1|nr:uncharacterized protein HMPREF1541_06743 [Cyphellophora europaea CBS 101466]ETN38706.1 hypothetical protein HMPREF1541_06743 [Cyphellophora europaea CBS 101466]